MDGGLEDKEAVDKGGSASEEVMEMKEERARRATNTNFMIENGSLRRSNGAD